MSWKEAGSDVLGRLSRWQWLKRPFARQWLLGGIVAATLSFIMSANLMPEGTNLKVGQVATRYVEAPATTIDKSKTEELQLAAAKKAIDAVNENPANFIVNEFVASRAQEKVDAVVTLIKRTRADLASDGAVQPGNQTEVVLRERILTDTGIDVSPENLHAGLGVSEQQLEDSRSQTLGVVRDILLVQRLTDRDVAAAKEQAVGRLRQTTIPSGLLGLFRDMVLAVIRPNLTVDPEIVQKAQSDAIQSVEPVRILKGQTIIRRGDIVTPEQVRLLKELGIQRAEASYATVVGLVLLVAVLLIVLGIYLYQHNRRLLENEGMLMLLGLVLVVIAFLAKVLSSIPWSENGYVIPVAFGSILVAILLESRLAIMVTVVLAIFAGVLTGGSFRFFLVALVGGIVGVFSVSRVSQRGDLMRAGVIVGAADLVTIVALAMIDRELGSIEQSYLGMVNGLVSSILAIGSLPYLESLFGITSAIRLLELSNPNHPLLKRMLLEAPGTYHHSIMVGNLAEAAAEAVEADPLLVRVGAYYHDIGKVRRPYFFVENQLGQDNPHDRISPSLSTLIITSHIKDGTEMAREAKLPDVVTDFIRQHHGTDLVKFFYHRALESDRTNTVVEQDFRYPGPKPQSKESAIVMLADGVEAAVRSLSRPTPGKVEGLVRKLIKDRLTSGELDESALTLGDLDRIAVAFVRVLSGIFHARVEYPDISTSEVAR